MKTIHLHDVWSGPDNSRLVSKQFSFRLPVHLAAKIAALGDMYPQKNRTQLVSDLLTAAMDNLEVNLPFEKGQSDTTENEYYAKLHAEQEGYEHEKAYMITGARSRFRRLTNKYYKEFEKELGNETAEDIYGELWLSEEEFIK